jgi:hypothetical protein
MKVSREMSNSVKNAITCSVEELRSAAIVGTFGGSAGNAKPSQNKPFAMKKILKNE